ncbi:MAG: hypothetical protein CSA45_03625 [Gammaproteobacteria bacterium]|nr:MAG: hypothetical protein CSA45_03625 [Gammaproteobacteria bacterium]
MNQEKLSETLVTNIYEHPFGERTKLLLRLEIIFKQAITYRCCRDQYETQMCLNALFALLNLTKRYELRSVFLQELERVNTILVQLQNSDKVNAEKIRQTCEKITTCKKILHGLDSKHIERMRNIDFLKAIKLRNIHETGTYLFEIPELQYWLLQDAGQRERQVKTWLEDFEPFRATADYLLYLLRDSAKSQSLVAQSGIYIKAVDTRSTTNQLLRINIKEYQTIYPSVSGDGYRYVIRFMERNDIDTKPVQTSKSVCFELSDCGI